ncbi:MAG: acyltransferase family protein, partial [Clostridia bacterium]|nr:acyltransferase family protein [Clostridia bacterium]
MQGRKRVEYIDIAKGIGILLVMLGHILVYESDEVLAKIQNFIYSFHLPMFFIITGILCRRYRSWENKSLSELLKGKLKTLIYPYFIFSAIMVLFHMFLYFVLHMGTYEEIPNIISMTIKFEGYGVLWYLFVLFIAIMMFYIFEKLKWNRYIVLTLLIFSGSFFAYQFPMFSAEFGIWNKVISYYFTRWIISCSYIYIGYLSASILQWDIWKNKMICTITGLLMAVLTFILCQFNGKPDLCI